MNGIEPGSLHFTAPPHNGFSGAGRHICLFYRTREERRKGLNSALQFIWNRAPAGCGVKLVWKGRRAEEAKVDPSPAETNASFNSPSEARLEVLACFEQARLEGYAWLLFILERQVEEPHSAPYALEAVFDELCASLPIHILCLFHVGSIQEERLVPLLQAHPWMFASEDCFENPAYHPLAGGFQALYARIIERQKAKRVLECSEAHYRTLVTTSPDGIALVDTRGQVLYASPRMLELAGIDSLDSLPERDVFLLVDPEDRERVRSNFRAALVGTEVSKPFFRMAPAGGEKVIVDANASPLLDPEGNVEGLMMMVRDMTDWLAMQEALKGTVASLDQANQALRDNRRRLDLLLSEAPVQVWTTDLNLMITSSMGSGLPQPGQPSNGLGGARIDDLFPNPPGSAENITVQSHRRALGGTAVNYQTVSNGRIYNARVEPLHNDQGRVIGVMGVGIDVTENQQAQEALSSSQQLAQALLDAVHSMAVLVDDQGLVLALNEATARLVEKTPSEMLGKPFIQFLPDGLGGSMAERIRQVCATGLGEKFVDSLPGSEVEINLQPAFDARGMVTRLAISIHNISDFVRAERLEREHRQVAETMRSTSEALSRLMKPGELVEILLNGVQRVIPNGAAHILIAHGDLIETRCPPAPASNHALYACLENQNLRVSETPVLRNMAVDRCPVLITELTGEQISGPLPGGGKARSYAAVPILIGKSLYGFIGVVSEEPFTFSSEHTALLDSFAGQAAITLEKAQVLAALETSHVELSEAYDATIAGWARALELRDKETEGHSQRVVELSLKLAHKMGVPHGEIVHLRWGALLHDIGKMAIPDHILLKPGPLSEEEWITMRQHPLLAFSMLSGIPYLRPALTIPYSHHEHWDGSGYPMGLRGEQIPLAARIFAVVDTYDALRSNRPYRPAWRKPQVVEYIISQSGKLFDPDVVQAFLAVKPG